jgi:hypothetical protein
MSGYTPGEWVRIGAYVYGPRNEPVAGAAIRDGDKATAIANADLIAAAPALLAALKELRACWEDEGAWRHGVADEAIERAEGR